MRASPRPIDRLKVTDGAFVLNLGFFAWVSFNAIHHTDGHITPGATWVMVDLFGIRKSGWLWGQS